MSSPFLHVVAGLLIEDGKVFIARRHDHDSSGGKWEFPGGKVEENEAPQSALVRELREELSIEVEVIRLFGSNRFMTHRGEFFLELYRVHRISGEISLCDHSECKWVSPHDLKNYDMLSGDLPFIQQIMSIKV